MKDALLKAKELLESTTEYLKVIGIFLIILGCILVSVSNVGYAIIVTGLILVFYELILALPNIIKAKLSPNPKEGFQEIHQKAEIRNLIIYEDGRFTGTVFLDRDFEMSKAEFKSTGSATPGNDSNKNMDQDPEHEVPERDPI